MSPEQLVAQWKGRGLLIADEASAAHYIKFIGYYRLSGYALPFTYYEQNGSHSFKVGTTFANILDLYRFDRELRLLVMDAIERVEVAFRTCVSDTMSLKAGPHWYMDASQFMRSQMKEEFCLKICDETGFKADRNHKTDGKETFIQHYYRKYSDPPLPPSWMIAEILPITSWSKIFGCLAHRDDRKRIAGHFGFNPEVIESWAHAICYIRNLCAHHARLWNREFTIKPCIARGHEEHLKSNGRFYAQAYVINALLKTASPQTTWWERLMKFIDDHAFIDRRALGFPGA